MKPNPPPDTTTAQLALGLPTEAQQILGAARRRGDLRAQRATPVDYDALNRMVRRQRAALTRAVNSGDIERIALACRDAVSEWDRPGAMWPDDWSAWQRALDDAVGWNRRVELRDLQPPAERTLAVMRPTGGHTNQPKGAHR